MCNAFHKIQLFTLWEKNTLKNIFDVQSADRFCVGISDYWLQLYDNQMFWVQLVGAKILALLYTC